MHPSQLSRAQCVAAGLSGITGVLMIGTSFAINTGPPDGAGSAQLIAFAATHFRQVMWGAWLQAVGPLLILAFALALVHLAGAATRLSGSLTLLGATVLMTVSLAEVVFYISALGRIPDSMGLISIAIAHAIQHLYFIVAAPAVFFPLGAVLWTSTVLPRPFAVLAWVLGAAFFILGITSLCDLVLAPAVTSLAAVQALWWMAAAVALIARSARLAREPIPAAARVALRH